MYREADREHKSRHTGGKRIFEREDIREDFREAFREGKWLKWPNLGPAVGTRMVCGTTIRRENRVKRPIGARVRETFREAAREGFREAKNGHTGEIPVSKRETFRETFRENLRETCDGVSDGVAAGASLKTLARVRETSREAAREGFR